MNELAMNTPLIRYKSDLLNTDKIHIYIIVIKLSQQHVHFVTVDELKMTECGLRQIKPVHFQRA